MAIADSKPTKAKNIEPAPIPFTGVARSMECYDQHKQFRNFKLVTMEIVNGIVVSIKKSDPYASFEAMARQEIDVCQATLSLNDKWEDGKTWST